MAQKDFISDNLHLLWKKLMRKRFAITVFPPFQETDFGVAFRFLRRQRGDLTCLAN